MSTNQLLKDSVPNKRKLSHANTVESRENRKNEDLLAFELDDFVNMLKRQFFQRNILDIYQIKNTEVSAETSLEKEFTYDILYPYVQEGYELGAQYINRLLGKRLILLPQDTQRIRDIAFFYNYIFWNRVKDVIDSNYLDFNNIEKGIQPKSNNYVVTSLATAIVWKALSVGSVEKAKSMIKQRDLTRIFQAGVKSIEKKLLKRNPGLFQTGEDENIKFIILVWKWVTSQDSKVCQVCRDLSNQEWAHDESFLPENPDDSHPNCRCRMMLGESGRPIL